MYQNPNRLSSNQRRSRILWVAAGLVSVLAVGCLFCGVAVVSFVLVDPLGLLTTKGVASAPSSRIRPSEPAALGDAPVTSSKGTPLPTSPPPATPTPHPTPTITPTPPGSTPIAVEPAEGWSFEGVRVQPDSGLGGLIVYGEALNDSGAPQRVLGLQSVLYDSQGKSLTKEVVDDYWPLETVPPEGRMPFELTVLGPSQADRVELQIATEPGNAPRTDFELSNIKGMEQETDYCVTGRARNLGQPLNEYLMTVAVLYDDDDRVINWGIGYQPADNAPVGDETVIVSACAERFNNVVARYDLRAWGE